MAGGKIGFIGAGNMGGAIAKSLILSGAAAPGDILVTDLDSAKTGELEAIGAVVCGGAAELAEMADIVIIAVKPVAFEFVLRDVSRFTKPLYVSIAAGITIKYIKSFFEDGARVIRAMPNTPALIGRGVTVVSSESPATPGDEAAVCEIFGAVGTVERMNEGFLNAVTSVSASSPAYVYMLIEAMADAAVSDGIPREMAYRLAAGAVAGSADMVLKTGEHPGRLKDMVCSPGGTTIRAVAELERGGFRSAVMEAMRKCTKRAEELTSDK